MSFPPTFVFQPLTPPYVPFGIRRSSSSVHLNIVVHKARVTCSAKVIYGRGLLHYSAAGYCPISLACVAPHIRKVWFDSTLLEVLYPCTWLLPAFPDTHTYPPAQPLVDWFKDGFHIRQLEVPDPAAYRFVEYLFTPLVSHSIAPACQHFHSRFQCGNALGVRPKPSPFSCLVERVAEELPPAYVAHFRLLAIYLQVKFLLDELRDAFAYAFRSPLALAED